ncbi:MAG: sigma-54 dependent transcriptional regulator [Bacillota bacterium]|nr:sigma-54 dependent transcriptional regulator [Bacillota bacterium]
MSNKGYKILIVDDEIEYQRVLTLILSDLGYKVASCSNGAEALAYLEKNMVQLVVTDLKMPVMDGVELIRHIRECNESVDIIVMTAFGSIESAVDSMRYGAGDYFVKSADMNELVMKVERFAQISRLRRKNEILLSNRNEEELFIETKNPQYRELLDMCERTADTGINILLLGESGVGKEVVANYIHRLSSRRQEPFVAINCQVYPEGVIESELFGHEKGSFTGAIETRVGKFEQANLGTLFLDEIGDLPLATQGKLLRAIENKKIERVGGNQSIDLDIRFVSATNKDLDKQILDGGFREDLLYRINTLTLRIPTLRERREDLPDLIRFFVRKIEADQKKKIVRIEPEVEHFLLHYSYPGNIRELKNIIERMIALSKDGIVTIDEIRMPQVDASGSAANPATMERTLRGARSAFERDFIEQALRRSSGNVTRAADELGLSTRQLWNKISQLKIPVEKRE